MLNELQEEFVKDAIFKPTKAGWKLFSSSEEIKKQIIKRIDEIKAGI